MIQFGGLFKTATFRLALAYSVSIFVLISLISIFIYWHTAHIMVRRADEVLIRDGRTISQVPDDQTAQAVERRLSVWNHVIVYAALFDQNGKALAGNLKELPQDLPLDGKVRSASYGGHCCQALSTVSGRLLGLALADGRQLVLGRNIESLDVLRQSITEALFAGLIPAILIALFAGTFLAHRTALWMDRFKDSAFRIEQGEIWHRLPVPDSNETFKWLVESVNRVLDGFGTVMEKTQAANAHLAHDLLMPLSGVKTRLEKATKDTSSVEEMKETVLLAIAGLDQTARLAGAMLKISSIDRGHIRHSFQPVDLFAVIEEIADLFSVVAEEKGIAFSVKLPPQAAHLVAGDQDLLMEAIANVVDNAIKFTPPSGHIELSLSQEAETPIIAIADNGPGLPLMERQKVMERFYRTDSASHLPGHGLGLSLVDAVARLHGFKVVFQDNEPGLRVKIVCES